MSDTWTQQGLAALKSGEKARAKQLFTRALSQDKQDVQAWLGMSLVINNPQKQQFCLQRVLELEPDNKYAKKWLTQLEKESHDKSVPQRSEPIPETTYSNKRFSFASLKQGLFGQPKLPILPIFLIILLLMTEMFLMLIGQRTGFWHNFGLGYVGSNGIANVVNSVLQSSPIWFVLFMVGYALLCAVFLRVLAYVPAFILWMVIFTNHLQSVIKWVRCSLLQSFQTSAASCSTVGFTSLFIIAVLVGSALAVVLWPRGTAVADPRSQKQPKLSIWTLAASASWLVLLTAWLIYRILTPAEGWVPITFDDGPTARASTNIAYDTDRQTAILFGGATEYFGPDWNNWRAVNDTWEWDGRNWIEKHPQNAPSPRFSHQMAYDPIRKVSVLFGGESEQGSLGDTWEWDGENWHMRTPSTSPPARCCSSLFFDPQRGKMILTAGLQSPEIFWSDIWEWDGNDWHYLETPNVLPQMSAYPLAYNDKQNQAIVLSNDQTWIWDGVSWHHESQPSVPPRRTDTSMAYDPEHDKIVLYGGCDRGNPECIFNDTWLYDDEGWREVTFSQDSPTLTRHLLFYDHVRKQIVLFGGYGAGGLQNLMWGLNLPEK